MIFDDSLERESREAIAKAKKRLLEQLTVSTGICTVTVSDIYLSRTRKDYVNRIKQFIMEDGVQSLKAEDHGDFEWFFMMAFCHEPHFPTWFKREVLENSFLIENAALREYWFKLYSMLERFRNKIFEDIFVKDGYRRAGEGYDKGHRKRT